MENVKVLFCKLCYSVIKDKSYELIEDGTKGILVVLLLKLDSHDDSKHVMCSVCSTKLFAALKFKMTCLYTDKAIKPYTDDTTVLPLDLRDIYKKERASEHVLDDVKICRLCMQPVKDVSEVKAIKEEQVDMLQKFVPEMNIFMIREPVTCKPCMDALSVHYNFLKECSDRAQNIGDFSNEQIPDAPSPVPSVDISLGIEDVDIKFEDVQHENISNEQVPDALSPVPSVDLDVKMENFEFYENTHQLIKRESIDINYEEIKSECEMKGEEMSTKEPAACSNQETHRIISSNELQITKHEENETSHMYRYEIAVKDGMTVQEAFLTSQMYQSETCRYETKNSKYFTSNTLIQKNPSQVQIYKCEFCNYETRHMRNLKVHILIHKGPSEVPIYKCETCNYEFKLKSRLKRHMLIHKNPLRAQKYKCETCNYESNRKADVGRHMLIHKSPSEVQKYNCEICNSQIKRKCDLKTHMLIHKDPSEVQIYKCEFCNYETRHMRNLKVHILIHKGPSEVPIYKCETCNYQFKLKGRLKRHMLIHKNPLRAQKYQCEICTYEVREKHLLEKHRLRHKNPSGVQKYKCETCNYQSKRRADLGRHMLIHKNP